MSTMLFIGLSPTALSLFLINDGDSPTIILLIMTPLNLLQSLESTISIDRLGDIIVFVKLEVDGAINSICFSFL